MLNCWLLIVVFCQNESAQISHMIGKVMVQQPEAMTWCGLWMSGLCCQKLLMLTFYVELS